MNEQAEDKESIRDLMARLAEPFDPHHIKSKPIMVQGNRALAIFFTDARAIMDRLDDVLGPENWQDDYEMLPSGSAVCRLRVRLGGEWIMKTDVGGPSEQPDEGDRIKAAVSDSLKRAAVKLGLGRYLYRLPPQWCDFDPGKKRFTQEPRLPASALPRQQPAPGKKTPATPQLPRDGSECLERLQALEGKFVASKKLQPRELLVAIEKDLAAAGFGTDWPKLSSKGIAFAAEATRQFLASRKII